MSPQHTIKHYSKLIFLTLVVFFILTLFSTPQKAVAAHNSVAGTVLCGSGDYMRQNTEINSSVKTDALPTVLSAGAQPRAGILGVLMVILLAVILLLSFILLTKIRYIKKIEKLLYADALTGLGNLSAFHKDALSLITSRKSITYAVVYMNIKQFRTINDTFGFREGDYILKKLAEILKTKISEEECCARISADQFVLLLRYEDWETLTARTLEIDREINGWVRERQQKYHLIMVFGVYVINEEEHQDLSLMLDFASYAERSAETGHKGETILYDETMRKEGLLQRALADRMQEAIEEGEFIAYYQPKVDMRTGKLIGSEALARWNYPGEGMISPALFIPCFEKNGSIIDLDFYIYEQVCKALRQWMDAGWPIYPVSCNFSRLHFGNPAFIRNLIEIAASYQIPHEYLEVEVTESVFTENIEQGIAYATALRNIGFSLSIDDFGTGQSSLGMLEYFTADVLKLDRSFIQNGLRGERQRDVVRNFIQLAEILDMKVICEGVEDVEQSDVLLDLGCLYAQGFYYAKPMPQNEFEALLVSATLSQTTQSSCQA